MKKILLVFLALSLIACYENGLTQDICKNQGTVLTVEDIRVIDGDTIEIMLENGSTERVRLMGIDAPESDQKYGVQSTNSLHQCINDSIVTIDWTNKDMYGRLIGKVLADGRDCNLNQIKQGLAWHYKDYQYNQFEYDRINYSNAEVVARNESHGLWVDIDPVSPSHYRKGINAKYEFNNTIYDLNEALCHSGGLMIYHIIEPPYGKLDLIESNENIKLIDNPFQK